MVWNRKINRWRKGEKKGGLYGRDSVRRSDGERVRERSSVYVLGMECVGESVGERGWDGERL